MPDRVAIHFWNFISESNSFYFVLNVKTRLAKKADIYYKFVDNIDVLRYNMTISKVEGYNMETIRPSSDLRNHYSEISKQCHEERNPVIITVNGRGDTAILGLQDYYQMKSELELLRTLAEAENDVMNDAVAPIRNTFDEIRKSLLERKADAV